VTGVRFCDGEEIPADLVVMAVGISRECRAGAQAGFIASAASSSPTHADYDGRIYAVGECVQIVARPTARRSLVDQAKVCANHLA